MLGKINIHNYEAFLLDYMEGNLNAKDIALLKEFALAHPELEIDLEDTELAYVDAEDTSFSARGSLKKTNDDLVSDELFIAYIENTLSDAEKHHVIVSCEKNSGLAKELDLYEKTIVVPDHSIIFENKVLLKKEAKIIEFSPFIFRAAAAILLVAVLVIILNSITDTNEGGQKFASVNKPFKDQMTDSDPANEVLNSVSSQPVASLNSNTQTKKENSVITPSKEQTFASNAPKETDPLATTKDQISSPKKEIIQPSLSDSIAKNALASNQQPVKKNSFVVLEEVADDEETDLKKDKKGFWAAAKRALSSLNKLGVKKVDGKEEVNSNSETYVLSLGNFSIEKNKYNAE